MSLSLSLDALIDALRVLPGVGPKTAQRMAFYLIERNRPGAQRLTRQLQQALETVRRYPTLATRPSLPDPRYSSRPAIFSVTAY